MKEIEKIFATKTTENGDTAYNTTGNAMTNILFMSQYYRNHLNEVPYIGNSDNAKLFAMFIRDPRAGLGERDLGRVLLKQAKVSPEEMAFCGRYDDLLDMYPEYVIEEAKKGNELAKKWLPRLTAGKRARKQAKNLCKQFNISEKEYRSLCKVITTESRLSENKVEEIEYAKVPSLALLKYWSAFCRKDSIRFTQYVSDVQTGTKKMNTSVTNCYDVFKKFVNCNHWSVCKIDENAETVFNQLKQVSLGSILPIIDNSGSMYDSADSQGKAKAVGHYVAVNNTYFPNHVVTFSRKPRLLDLGNTYESAMKTLCSYDDCSNTNFGAVMDLLAKLETDFPDWLLVLSDMEFDCGSSTSKDETMKILKDKGAQTKIIWWNFNTRNTTCPEMDDYGNVFLSGYSPQLLSFLECGFNQEQFLNKLLMEYAMYVRSSYPKSITTVHAKEASQIVQSLMNTLTSI